MIISIIVLRSVIEYYKLPNKVTISVFYYFICTDFMYVLMRYIYLYVCVHMYLLHTLLILEFIFRTFF